MAVDNISRFMFLLLSVSTLWLYYSHPLSIAGYRMSTKLRGWQGIAAAKRMENMAKIPQEWHLDDSVINNGRKQKKLAGYFIESLLDKDTRTITGLDVGDILRRVQNGSLTSVQVTSAFCKRGAFAHQLVRLSPFFTRRLS